MTPSDVAVRPFVVPKAVAAPRESALASVEGCQDSTSGFIVTDLGLTPVYANQAAFQILKYAGETPEGMDWETAVQRRLRFILKATQFTSNSCAPALFISGRRQYVCRFFRLDVWEGNRQPQLVALLLERPVRQPRLLEASQRFHLSPRESEAVLHLTQGLTTKEIAQRMNVSPNTVKQFVRLIMSKMRVTTRSGIVGKLFAS